VITSFYKHPLEMTMNSILGSLLVYSLMGLDVRAGAIYTFFTAVGEFYGDFVWWDMLFGTYENPPRFTSSCGFDDEKEQRLGAMPAFRDVHA
jgi:sterol desaturase/sphingolipid hydroxylase (fatty acid hydroxylase superfamily)